MYLKKLIFLFVTILIFNSCENNQVEIDANNLLLGNWINPVYDSDFTTFSRSSSLKNDAYGISFKKTGKFIERSSGFCGTPPLIFSDYEGKFNLDENIIQIDNYLYQNNFQWEIISLSESDLVVKRVLSEQEEDHRALMELYNELYYLAYSESCTDISDWTYTAFGSKACGGPQGYIAYSTKIDVALFLQKITNYNNAEKEFNLKWDIVSECSIPSEPTRIECYNGYATLIY